MCEEIFTTKENIFLLPRTNDIENWEEGLAFITKMIEIYLENGKYANILKGLQAVGVGFVDDDIKLLYQAE